MLNRDIFKSYDIRGIYPNQINEEVVEQLAPVFLKIFKKGKIVVGYDARHSSPILYKALLRSLAGREVIALGMAPTELVYFAVERLKAAGGLMITASHNPKRYNGIKVIRRGGEAISGREIWECVI